MLGLLITICGLVVGRGMVDWGISGGMVNSMVNSMVNRGMVNSMVGNNRGMVDSVVGNNRGSMMKCMMNRGSMMDTVSTESCKGSGWATSHKGDKSNQSKDLQLK